MASDPEHYVPPLEECTEVYAYLNIEDPLIAWLVYRGEIVSASQLHSGAVSVWASGYLRTGAFGGPTARYEAELVLERLRSAEYPTAVSRLQGFFVFPDRQSATQAEGRWDSSFHPEFFAELGIRPGSRTSTHDANWITHCLGTDDSTEWMRAYLSGQPYGSEPTWETLVDGRAWIYGTELREAAYEIVKAEWPNSLALLELSRVAAWVDSNLGVHTAFALREGDEIAIKYIMNFEDIDNPDFVARVASPHVEKNSRDWHAGSELVLPDLRSREFRFRAA